MRNFKTQLKHAVNLQSGSEFSDLFIQHKDTFPPKDALQNLMNDHYAQWLEDNKTSNKVCSKKAMLRLANQKFYLHLKEKKTHLFFRCHKVGKSIGVKWVALYYTSTPKGLIYFQEIQHYQIIFCYYAHFFDRFATRGMDVKISNRENIIKEFIFKYQSDFAVIYDTTNNEAYLCFSNGMILGSFVFLQDPQLLMTWCTFLSEDMLKPEQHTMWKAAREKKFKCAEPYFIVYL